MKYKLVCIDMDGTLLNSKKTISERTKATIKNAYQLGTDIVITTGRVYENAAFYSKLIGVNSPIIASNGSIIRGSNNNIIYRNVMNTKSLKRILDVCEKCKVKVNFYTNNSVICGSRLVYVLMKYLFLKSMIICDNGKIDIEYVTKNDELIDEIERNADKILRCEIIHASTKKIREVKERLKKIDAIEVVSSTKNNIEITSKSVSKGAAIQFLAQYYNIQKKEIIAIGDSENDLSMIKYAGVGVAMGNGDKFIKSKADYVTDTNDNDGVAKVISKFILNSN